MELVSVYRIENTEGSGPYCWGIGEDPELMSKGLNCSPIPLEDGINDFSEDHHFGFISARQMFRWFREGTVRQVRSSRTWGIYLYRVPREQVIFGGTQVAFVKRSHVGVKRLV